ncbi:hypothetical protein PAMA_010550 [Pampus argenteus]
MEEPCIPVRMNHLCCRICSEFLRNPVTISCGHNFCMQCIQDCWDREERNNLTCSCPECGCSFTCRPQLIKNTTLADLVRDTEGCAAGSEKRKQRHSGESLKRPHSCTVTGTPGETLCWRHNKPLNVYCCTDERIICEECASDEHGGHIIGLAGEEWRRKQLELENMKAKSKQILQKHEEKWKNTETILERIQRHYQSVRQLIEAHQKTAAARARISLQALELKIVKMRKREAELDRLAQTDNNVYFLQEWPSLLRLCEEDHLHAFHEVSEDPLLRFESIKKAVEQFGRKLEAFCDKEFGLISQTADRGEQQESGETKEDDMQESDEASISQSCGLSEVNNTATSQPVEPSTRAEFLQYACELTLDPATAHGDLLLSEDNKEVRMCPQKCKRPAIRSPERFVYRRQVLCKEGLQGERCYYEIEVEGDKAEIALTYRGIDRKSRLSHLSAFGGNANSWSLDRSTQYSVSHKDDSIQLTTSPSCHRIGVYLKFREGTLSFYEVSERMTFLYKVEAEFTEALYPGFWLGEKCCIRISDLTLTNSSHNTTTDF